MSAIVASQRGRAGSLLFAGGILLLVFSLLMFISATPAGATHESGHDTGLCHWNEGQGQQGSWTFHPGLDTSNPGHDDHEHDFDAPSKEECESTPPPNGTTTTTSGATTTTTSGGDTTTTTSGGDTTTTTSGGDTTTTTSGGDTTTTTNGGDTTTTVLGPEDPTTTTNGNGGSTTTVAGPDDPELPDNGAGQLLSLFLGGLGLLFMGSGSLVIASERKRLIAS